MTTFEYALIIRDTLDIDTVLNYYGLTFNNRGFTHCPFHSENTASFKIKNRQQWHCFGCGKTGDAIDFVIDYYGLKWREALSKLNNDFGLNLPIDRKQTISDTLKASRKAQEIAEQRAFKAAEYERVNEAYETMLDTYAAYDTAIMRLKPKPGDTNVDSCYLYALTQIEYYKHLIRITPFPERG